MGACASSSKNAAAAQSSPLEREKSRLIDQDLKREKASLSKLRSILMLGAGEAGKTTVLRQMRFIYGQGLDRSERLEFRSVILSNTLQSMVILLESMPDMNLKLGNPALEDQAKLVKSTTDAEALDPRRFGQAIAELWTDKGVRACWLRSNEIQLNDSAEYFFDNVGRITSQGYVPDDDDIVRARIRTTGVSEDRFEVDGTTYRIVDVGGQRAERRKWISVFEGIDCILFVISLSEYDQVLREDASQNRLVESLVLFKSIVNSRYFYKTAFVVFLNKTDLFKEKVRVRPLKRFLADAPDSEDWKVQAEYIKQQFEALNENKSRAPYFHLTCATSTSQMRKLTGSVLDAVARQQLQGAGLL